MATIVLENGLLRAAFDKATGALVVLSAAGTGTTDAAGEWVIQRRAELGQSFRLLVPLEGRRNNRVIGEQQAAPQVERLAAAGGGGGGTSAGGAASDEGPGLRFVWPRVCSEFGGEHEISVTVTVRLGDEGLTFSGEIENRSPQVVEAAAMPAIGDLSRPAGAKKLRQMSMSYWGLGEMPLWPKFQNTCGYWGVDHPTQMVQTPGTPFVLIDSGHRGLYVGYHETSADQLVSFMLEQRPGWTMADGFSAAEVPLGDEVDGQPVQLSLTVWHMVFVQPGQTLKLGRVVMSPYVGTWHAGADCYKRWRATWFVRPQAPAWLREVHSWHQLHINGSEDDLRCRYEDLVAYGREAARHGVRAIQLVGWNDGGQDRGNPSHKTDPRLGTAEELRAAIEEIQSLGVKVVLFNKYTWADRSTAWFREELVRWAVKDPYGDYHVHGGYAYQTPVQLAGVNLRRLVPMCHNAAAWREIACREFVRSIELGAAGMLYDESQHHAPATCCFDAGHGHRIGANVYGGDAALAEAFHAVARQRGAKDYLFAGEACYDLELRHYHLSYFRIARDHVAAHRYIDPGAEMMIGVYGYDDRTTINQALLHRYVISYEPRFFKGHLEEFPLTLAYGKQVDALRQRYAGLLWEGEYRDVLGATVKQPEGHDVRHTVFVDRRSGRRAVVVANMETQRESQCAVCLDGGAGVLTVATPEAPERRPSDGTIVLPAASAAVFFEG